MASSFGDRLRVTIFGQSHGEAIGVVMEGLPAGEPVDEQQLHAFLQRRAPGRSPLATARREEDRPQLLSGVAGGVTCGAPLCAVIKNADARSSDYAALANLPRPGHADFTARMRYGQTCDLRGGGHFSGRLTAPLCIAGGIAMQILARHGVFVGAHAASVGAQKDACFDPVSLTQEALLAPGRRDFPAISDEAAACMAREIREAAAAGDSVGGTIECAIIGLPAGLGDPMFDGVENRLARILFGIPAVKGVEFGAGFSLAELRGSQANDEFAPLPGGGIGTRTNRCGGALGGITTGMPVMMRVVIKPTPSISRPQWTVDLRTGQPAQITVPGRHDPCIVPRAVPCVEAAAACAALDMLIGKEEQSCN